KRLCDGIRVLLTSGNAADVLARHRAEGEFPVIGKPFRRTDLAQYLRLVMSDAERRGSRPAIVRRDGLPDVPRRCAAGAERALHHDHVGPLSELVGDRWQQAHLAKATSRVQADRGPIAGVDIADHLTITR